MVPIYRVLGRVSHGGQKNPPGVGLGIEVTDVGAGPGLIALEVLFVDLYCNGPGRTEGRTSTTADAVGIVLGKGIISIDIGVDLVRALTNADLAADAFGIVAVDDKLVE